MNKTFCEIYGSTTTKNGEFHERRQFQEGERLFRAHSHFDIMKGGTQGFPRHEVSDKQEVLFEDVSPSTAISIRQLDIGQEFSG